MDNKEHSSTIKAERRLSAVLAADVASYSRLMQLDEEHTIQTWWEYRQELIDPEITRHAGRIVKLTGDGFLAEFTSATSAVNAAYNLQKLIEHRARSQPEDKRMRFRMGINLGDIFSDDEDVYGDHVNIAARLEGIAEPGSVLISRSVFEQAKRASNLVFEDMGDQHLKNMSEPVRAYRILRETGNHSCMVGDLSDDTSSVELPVKPNSVVVLPFVNFSGDSDQEYFADGFTEDLITELSRFTDLTVLSRNASFSLKGQNLDAREIGRRFAVSYCLEGSVRKMGQRVRVTGQLIRASSGDHVWADKFDCLVDDLFDTQDDFARSIVAKVAGKVEQESINSFKKKMPENMEAYECLLRGLEHHRLGGVTKQSAFEAMRWIDLALEKDPDYGRAYAWRACAIGNRASWTGEDWWEEAISMSRRSLELDDTDPECHRIAGSLALYQRDFDRARYHFSRALEINPNHAYILGRMGELYLFLGEPEKALQYQQQAVRLDPGLPGYCRELEVIAYYLLGDYQKVVCVVAELPRKPRRCCAYAVAALTHFGDKDQLQRGIEELLACDPEFSVCEFMKTEFYWSGDLTAQIEGDLLSAGLPE